MQPPPHHPLLQTIHALAVEIGPRPSATTAEARAADYVAGRLRASGFETTIEPFSGLRSFSLTYAILYAGYVVAALLCLLDARLGFAVALFSFIALLLENGGTDVVSRLLPKSPSRNVVGIKRPTGETKHRIVVTCHLDSTRSGLLWHPQMVAGFRSAFLTMLAVMLAVIVLTGALALIPTPPRFLWWLLAAAAIYLLGCVLLLAHRQLFMNDVAGANDNASGVAVALHVAAQMESMQQSELWIVATGCEESGLIGMARFCDRHQLDPATTDFINVDNCGAGNVTITTSEGMLWRANCDPALVRTATEAATWEPSLNVRRRAFHVMNNDSFIPLRRGYRALSIMAFDEAGLLPNWHWKTDTIENIDPTTLQCAAELAVRLVRKLETGGWRLEAGDLRLETGGWCTSHEVEKR